jgi:hypothetical protein
MFFLFYNFITFFFKQQPYNEKDDAMTVLASSFMIMYISVAYLGSTRSLIAVLSSPSICISVNAGMHTRSMPLGATNPLAMAVALIAWFKAPAPIACISAPPFSLNTPANAPATELGFDLADTFKISIIVPPVKCFHLIVKYFFQNAFKCLFSLYPGFKINQL